MVRTPSRASSPLAGMNDKPGRICAVIRSTVLALNRLETPRMWWLGTTTPAGASSTESAPVRRSLCNLAACKYPWECLQQRRNKLPYL